MMFGNRNKFSFDIEPVSPHWEHRAPSDRGPWALLKLWVSGQNLTENMIPGSSTVEPGVYVPLARIADWFVRNLRFVAFQESAAPYPTDVLLPQSMDRWKATQPRGGYNLDQWDDVRFAWAKHHFITYDVDELWLPNIALVRSDRDLWINWQAERFASSNSPIFLAGSGHEKVYWDDAFAAIEDFVAKTAAWIREADAIEAYPWSIQDNPLESILDLSVEDFVSLAVPAGNERVLNLFGAEDTTQLLNELGLAPESRPEDSVALQVMRDLSLESDIKESLIRCERQAQDTLHSGFQNARGRIVLANVSVEDQGYEAAQQLRQCLSLGDQPLNGFAELFRDQLGIEVVDSAETSKNDYCLAGGRVGGSGVVVTLRSPQTARDWSRRMEILRGVGLVLMDAPTTKGAIGAGSSSRATGPRRRRSGAFAAEMLLPRSALFRRTGGVLDVAADPEVFSGLLTEYHVGAKTAAWHLWNSGLLSSRDLVEDLIAEFGYQP